MSKSTSNYFIDTRKYHKSNYDDALRHIIPSIYFEEDEKLATKATVDILDQVINSHLNIINNFSSIINISLDYLTTTQYSSINTPSGIAKFFIKQNNLTNIEPIDFERNILNNLSGDSNVGYSLRNFETSAEFSYFVSNTLLPGIKLNNPTLHFGNLNSDDDRTEYLINTLSWLYFLNLDGSPTYNSSGYVHDLLVGTLYQGKPILLNDVIKGLTEYVWRNYNSNPSWASKGFLPVDFIPPLNNNNKYTSGTQQLDRLKTLIDIVYSPSFMDRGDTKVADAIDDLLTNGYLLRETRKEGPFTRLIKAFSFGFSDYNSNADKLSVLYDVNQCPPEYLKYLAELIGWKLFGSDPDKWRLQIVNAIEVYKRVGTKQSIQYAINSVFNQDSFDVSSRISELWESYVPFLMYYALATDSKMLSSFDSWTRDIANKLKVSHYNISSMDENVKLVVDQILYELALEFSSNFIIANNEAYLDPNSFIGNYSKFPIGTSSFVFNYRGRTFPVPPFEEYPYYVNTILTNDLINAIGDKLVCFGVTNEFAAKVTDYIRQNTVFAQDDIRFDNKFLIFTSAAQYPPNWDEVILDISNKKVEYLPLWSSKSSHFRIDFNANEFDFTKNSQDIDSREALGIVSDIVKDFVPAHAIPQINADISGADIDTFANVVFPYLNYDSLDFDQILTTPSAAIAGYASSALSMSTYKRGLTPSTTPTFSRWNVDSLIDPLVNYSGTTASLPRRNHRRRNLKFILPKSGYYDRTGFNMPVTMDVSTVFTYPERSVVPTSGFLPLGLIPSSQQYVPIPDYNNIPAIYDRCENLGSTHYFSGLWVSNTFPCRGWRKIESNAKYPQSGNRPDYYHDLGQLHPYIAVLHSIKEKAKICEASSYYYTNNLDYVYQNNYWKNILGSYANSSTELSGNFPNSFDDYANFSFGRDFHKFYADYSHYFRSASYAETTDYFPLYYSPYYPQNPNDPGVPTDPTGTVIVQGEEIDEFGINIAIPKRPTSNPIIPKSDTGDYPPWLLPGIGGNPVYPPGSPVPLPGLIRPPRAIRKSIVDNKENIEPPWIINDGYTGLTGAPVGVADLYFIIGDDNAYGTADASTLSTFPEYNTIWNDGDPTVSNVFIFCPSASNYQITGSPTSEDLLPRFESIRPGKNTQPTITTNSQQMGMETILGYKLQQELLNNSSQPDKKIFIIKVAKPASIGFRASLTEHPTVPYLGTTAIPYGPGIATGNDWDPQSVDDLFDTFKSWATSALTEIRTTFNKTRILLKGGIVSLGTIIPGMSYNRSEVNRRLSVSIPLIKDRSLQFFNDFGVNVENTKIVFVKPDSRLPDVVFDSYVSCVGNTGGTWCDPNGTGGGYDIGIPLGYKEAISNVRLYMNNVAASDSRVTAFDPPTTYGFLDENPSCEGIPWNYHYESSAFVKMGEDIASIFNVAGFLDTPDSAHYKVNLVRSTHRLNPNILYLNGPTIFGHAFGSLLKNSKFKENGSLTLQRPDLIVTSLDRVTEIFNASGPFSISGVPTSSVYITYPEYDAQVEGAEYRNYGILDHIELCQSVSSSDKNSFTIYRLDKSGKNPNKLNPLLYENTLIKQVSRDGFGRIIFDISRYQTDSNQLYDIPYNFLLPEHSFKFNFKALISDIQGENIGNGEVGIWIHTKVEQGKVWSYNKYGKWVQHSASDITISSLVAEYANMTYFKPGVRTPVLKCAKYVDRSDPNRFNQLLNSFDESEFTNIEINFHTRNKALCSEPDESLLVPNEYYNGIAQQVHRYDQDYFIEIFTLPTKKTNFTLYYDVNMIDVTLNTLMKPLVGGIRNKVPIGNIYCPECRVDLTREEVLTIIKYFNGIGGAYINTGYASRDPFVTSGIYEASGGSRLNYVNSPDWYAPTRASSLILNNITLKN